MVNMNDRMKLILKDERGQGCYLEIDAIVTEITNNTKIIRDCIIYDKDGVLEEEKINFERILKMVGDWTGYEVSCNELRFNLEVISPRYFLKFADKLSSMLIQKYTQKKVVVYITLYDDEIELRFHTYSKDERLWLDKDLNKYNVPILCLM